MNINDLAVEVAAREAGKREVNVAQIKQVLAIINKMTGNVLYTLVKLLTFIALMGPMRPAFADSVLDQLYGGFVGRAKLSLESTTKGTIQPEFLVNYIEIGRLNGAHIAAVDAGALGTVLPDGGFKSVDWTTGGKIHLSPIIKRYVPLPAEWQFLGELELDARASYNWTAQHPFYGLVASVPFK